MSPNQKAVPGKRSTAHVWTGWTPAITFLQPWCSESHTRLLWCRQIGKVLWLRRWRLRDLIPLKTNRKLTVQICVMCGEKWGEGSSLESLGLPVFIGACCHPCLLSILAFCAASERSVHCLRWDEEPSGCCSLTGWSWDFSAENTCWKWMQWCLGVQSLSVTSAGQLAFWGSHRNL